MKRLLILLILLACISPLATAAQQYPNTSQMFLSNNVFVHGEPSTINRSFTITQACNAYSATVYSPYQYTLAQKISDGTWWEGPGSIPSEDPNYNRLYPHEMGYWGWDNASAFNRAGYAYLCTFASGYQWVVYDVHPLYNGTANAPTLNANFVGTPLNGTGPLEVTLQNTSSNVTGAATFVWSISPSTGVDWLDPDQEGETQVITIMQDGNYTVSLNVTDSAPSTDTETKVSYINVYNSSATGTVRIRPLDAVSGYPIQGANISVFDHAFSKWTNVTATTGEVSVSINNGDIFDAYGSAYGYDDNDFTGETAVNNKLYTLPMYPSTMPNNVSAGNVTLYVTVVDADDSTQRISGATVSVAAPWPTVMSSSTNSNGLAQFTVKNNTEIMIAVSKVGYMSANRYINSGTGSGGDAYIEQTVLLERLTVTTAPTVTTLPGGGTPTPTVTADPYPCDADHPENCKRKQTDMANILVQYGPMLVLFFIALTIIGGVKQIGR